MKRPSDILTSFLAEWIRNPAACVQKALALPFVRGALEQLHRLQQDHSRTDGFGRDERLMEFLRPLFQFLFYHYFRVDVVGAEHIPKRGNGLIVSNHSGTLPYDGAMIHLAVFNHLSTSRPVYFLVDDFISRIPLLAQFIQRIGGQPASPENALRLLEAGKLVAVFPEGVRGVGKLYEERYRLQRFGRGGFVRLAMRAKTSIIPTAVIGAEEIHPLLWKSEALAAPFGLPYIPVTPTFPFLGPLGLVPLPSKWKIIFGKPISLKKVPRQPDADPVFVEERAAEIRIIIQTMIDKELRKRKSIWY